MIESGGYKEIDRIIKENRHYKMDEQVRQESLCSFLFQILPKCNTQEIFTLYYLSDKINGESNLKEILLAIKSIMG